MIIHAVRLRDGTLFHTSDMGELIDYWDAHEADIVYMSDYYTYEQFEKVVEGA